MVKLSDRDGWERVRARDLPDARRLAQTGADSKVRIWTLR